MIRGNLVGIKKTYIKLLDQIFDIHTDKNNIVDEEIVNIISSITSEINREVSVYINRRGKVVDVAVGDENSVNLEFVTERRSSEFLNGIRCIHTHPNGNGEVSSVDLTALVNMKFDLMVAIGVKNGTADNFSFSIIKPVEGKLSKESVYEGPFRIELLQSIDVLNVISYLEERLYDKVYTNFDNETEKVILVGTVSEDGYSSEESIEELEELANTAGAEVVAKVIQNKAKVDPSYYIGTGKVKEIALMRQTLMAHTVIFDDELSGAQVRNLEEALGCKVIDRTTLILDIFAQRAISKEGKLQVELAQLKYRLPRLIGLGGSLSRTGGGIGTRGPGEKKLEIDRRRIKRELIDLERQLKDVKKTRQLQRERRKSKEIPVISLVGYTNVGKSTIRNKLCDMAGVEKEKVLEANMLFATLDTTTRSIELPSGKECLISDTVGFIRKLPHDLVEAFKSTLEEIVYSNLVIHVADASSENVVAQIDTVNGVLKDIGAEDKELLLVLNKVDKASDEAMSIIRAKYPDAIYISAKQGINLDLLLKSVEESVYKSFIQAKLLVPYTDSRVISYLHNNKCVESEEYTEDGVEVFVNTTQDILGRVREFIVQ
ncbi:GTPase HflX [Clostridium cylindrosporum]|uniref:GTPase HflX n=1 Tax=Clostridium cylindrosporum DSM 605 TaxID=1121307 RepID=A0A0J8D505_CLOCY|nr:GTPase HflX [Clostridium cylindrosporum]KMT21245.1 GTP-binding protein HflX [Clostridium cylindrosporum DSM 605]